MLLAGLVKPLPAPRLIPDAKAIDMTPWRPAYWIGGALLVVVIAIYASMAKF